MGKSSNKNNKERFGEDSAQNLHLATMFRFSVTQSGSFFRFDQFVYLRLDKQLKTHSDLSAVRVRTPGRGLEPLTSWLTAMRSTC